MSPDAFVFRKPASPVGRFDPQHRGIFARAFWGLSAAILLLGGTILVGVGTFAPPEMDRIHSTDGTSYAVNMMHILYVIASALIPAGLFSLWKSAHRGGLGFWRATARPALMTAATGLAFAGLTSAECFAAGGMQQASLTGSGAAALAAFVCWLLRGPSPSIREGDEYWHRSYAVLFAIAGLVAALGTAVTGRAWAGESFSVKLDAPRYSTLVVPNDECDYSLLHDHEYDGDHDYDHEDFTGADTTTVRVPARQYNRMPIAVAMLGLIALGCTSEVRNRLRMAGRARAAVFGG